MKIIPLNAHSTFKGSVATTPTTDYVELISMPHETSPGTTLRLTSVEAFELAIQLIQDARESDRRKYDSAIRRT